MQGAQFVNTSPDFFTHKLVSSDQLEDVATRKLFEWWLSQAEGSIPSWRCFDILNFLDCAKNLTVTERQADHSFKFVIQGEDTIELFGKNWLKKLVIAPDRVREYERHLFHYYDKICSTATPHFFRGSLYMIERNYLIFESVDLPFCDETGEVNRILSILVKI